MRIFKGKLEARNQRNGMLFALPWFIGFSFFTLYPILISIYYSFCKYSILTPPQWIGLNNFITLFTEDNLFWTSLYNTIYYTAFSLPIGVVIGVIIALFLNLKVRGMPIYRTIYYLPVIVPVVASSILWMWILNPQLGLINTLLEKINITGPGWLSNPKWSKPALILMSWWAVGGAILIYLASLQDVPQQLYEAAEIDGANWWQKTFNITIPMITPAIFFILVMGLIGSFQYFTQVYIMTNGGPINSTLLYALYLYRNAFVYYKMGYACSMAWFLFILVLALTLLVFKSSIRWVYYGGKLK